MKIYIIPFVTKLTDSYHSSGGLVVIAENLKEAKKLAPQPTQEEWDSAQIADVSFKRSEIFIFPDAGCC